MKHRLTVIMFVAAMLMQAATFAGGQWQRPHFNTTCSLEWNSNLVAIQWNEGREQSSLLDLGISEESVQPYALRGWSMIEVPAGISSLDTFNRFVDTLAGHDLIRFATPVFVDDCGGPLFPTRDLLVRFTKEVSVGEARHILARHGTIVEERFGNLPGAYRLQSSATTGSAVLAAAQSLQALETTQFAEPDFCFTGKKVGIPNDARLAEMWAVNQGLSLGYSFADIDMDIIEAWDISTGNPAIKIAVLDDGVQMNHPDMPYHVPGTDTTTDPGSGEPFNGFDNHGTSVAGIISAVRNNGLGVSGLVPDAQLVSVRCYLSTTVNSFISMSSWTVNALAWCETNGVHITNNSVVLGLLPAATTMKYDATAANGMIHYAAAGNDPLLGTRYPASLASVHGMIGLTFDGTIAPFSASGANMAFSAPADQILTVDRSGADGYLDPDDYVYQAGTSFATAYASASAGLALSVNPALTPAEVTEIMGLTARDLGAPGFDATYAGGMLNAYGIAFQAALSRTDPSDKLFLQSGAQSDSLAGSSVAYLGDLDGDGIAEFSVASPLHDGPNGIDAGRVEIYSGASGGVLHTQDGATPAEAFGKEVTGLGDIDLDNVPDYAISAPHATVGALANAGILRVYSGATHTEIFNVQGTQANELLGSTIISMGDMNMDARADFAVSSPGATVNMTANVGRICIYSGIDGSPLLSVDGIEGNGDLEFGYSMVRIDDQDLDSHDDILVGVPGADPGGPMSGRLVIISSSTGNRLQTVDGFFPNDRLGESVTTWSDQNVDGIRDFVASAPGFDGPGGLDSGVVIVYESNMMSPILAYFGENSGDRFGASVTNNLDMDGDLVEDLVIGAPCFDGHGIDCGKVYSYSTAAAKPRFEILGREANQRLGCDLAPLGDIDNDGLAEMIIGGEGSDVASVRGFSVIVPAPNPAHAPALDATIMKGTLGSNENGPYDTFFINNSAGGAERTVTVGVSEPLNYSMLQPTGNPLPAHFALYGFLGFPPSYLNLTLPFGIGDALWVPCTATPSNPIGFLITNSTFQDPCPQLVASTPTPWQFTDTIGVPFPITVTFYGIVEEGVGSLKVTNSIILQIQ